MTKILILSVLIMILIIIFLYVKTQGTTLVKSSINLKSYYVRDLPDKQDASNYLAKITKNIKILVEYLNKHKNEFSEQKPYIEQLTRNIKNVIITENNGTSKYTSYSINKGEKIVFCLRSKKTGQLHNFNLIMYVVLHELSHVACPEYGHTELFNKIFAFITNQAINIGLYSKINFYTEPEDYCGMIISSSVV